MLEELALETARQISAEKLRAGAKRAAGFHWDRYIGGWYAGEFDDEDLYDYEVDAWRPGRFVIDCPSCERRIKPLVSKTRLSVSGGWKWCGISHQEPYTNWMSVCPGCKSPVLFTLVTPQ